MKWVKGQLSILVTLSVLMGGWLVAWGRTQERLQQLTTQIEAKADKETITRELDLIQVQLSRIEDRLDGVIVQRAIVDNP